MRVHCKARTLRLLMAAKRGYELPISEVVAATGLAYTSIKRLETNRSTGIDYETIVILCQYYGVDIADLLALTDEPDASQPKRIYTRKPASRQPDQEVA